VSGNFETNVRHLVDVLADSCPFAVVAGTSVVPAVLGGGSIREAFATLVTEELSSVTVVLVEVEFELCPERPLAVSTSVWHIP
jgi:hypothetical protein